MGIERSIPCHVVKTGIPFFRMSVRAKLDAITQRVRAEPYEKVTLSNYVKPQPSAIDFSTLVSRVVNLFFSAMDDRKGTR